MNQVSIPKVLLGVIDNKRPEFLAATIESLQKNINYNFGYKVLINDSGDAEYARFLESVYGDYFDQIISHKENLGLSGSIRSLWALAEELDVDYVWHQEGDFTFNENISIEHIIKILENDRFLAQVALKRQPCNPTELEYGGFMELNRDSYLYNDELNYLSHSNFFTLNPSLYPRWVYKLGWESGWGEAEFSSMLFSNRFLKCGYLGSLIDQPKVLHIGGYRAEGWFV
jgi:hypothetical protein